MCIAQAPILERLAAGEYTNQISKSLGKSDAWLRVTAFLSPHATKLRYQAALKKGALARIRQTIRLNADGIGHIDELQVKREIAYIRRCLPDLYATKQVQRLIARFNRKLLIRKQKERRALLAAQTAADRSERKRKG